VRAIVGKWRRLGTVRVCGASVAWRCDPLSDRLGHEWATYTLARMSTGEWVLIVVGAVQAIALAVAAIFAWKAYGLAKTERREAGKERRASEDRRLLQSIIDEVMTLALDAEKRESGFATPRLDVVEGDLQRLRIALAFAPMRLAQTDLLSRCSPGDADTIRKSLEGARVELATAAEKLAPQGSKEPSRPAPAMLGQKRSHSGPSE
jgi:hypothetical protein